MRRMRRRDCQRARPELAGGGDPRGNGCCGCRRANHGGPGAAMRHRPQSWAPGAALRRQLHRGPRAQPRAPGAVMRLAHNQAGDSPPQMRGPDRGRDRASHPVGPPPRRAAARLGPLLGWGRRPVGPPRPLAFPAEPRTRPDRLSPPHQPRFRTSRVCPLTWGRPTRRRKDDAETPHTVRSRQQALLPSRRMRCGGRPMV